MNQSVLPNTKATCCSTAATAPGKPSLWLTQLLTCTLLLFALQGAFVQTASAQGTGGSGIYANFGIDGDLYAGRFQFPAIPCRFPSNDSILASDDWFGPRFSQRVPGQGIGIIDTTGAAAFKALVGCPNPTNHARTFNKSFNSFDTYIYGTHSITLIDAVAARDHYGLSGNLDSTTFVGNSNKNSDNPLTWSLGPGTSGPNKNDIIDIGAHLRRETDLGTGAFQDWGYAFATTLSTNGDSHLDFEIFRNDVSYDPVAGHLVNTGTDGGHTAYTFNSDGSINVPGDFILIGDYVNGGTQVDVHMRVWVNPTALPGATSGSVAARFAAFNTLANRPFNFSTATADFDAGPAPWYYATILPKAATDTFAFTRVNADPAGVTCPSSTTNTLGTPWGNMWESGPSCGDSIQTRQFVEGAINFGLLGQAVPIASGACRNIFGSFLVKTRSSASFTAELKDFAGPYPFGSFTPVDIQAVTDTIDCNSTSVQICASSQSVGPVTLCWSGPAATPAGPFPAISCAPAGNPVNNYCITVTQAGYYHAVSTLSGSCFIDTVIQVLNTTDVTPPTITCAANATIDCPATPTWPLPTATDNVDPSPVVTQVGSEVCSGTCPQVCTRTYMATDACGNTSTCSRSVTVRDITAPSITCPAVTSPINCPATPTFGVATASDACTPSVAITFSDATTPGTCPANFTVTRTWTATDGCGNTSTCSRSISVQDVTPPSITCPTVSSTPISCPATPSFGAATASDACDPSVAISFSDATTPGSCPANYTVTRTWTATDDCGNTSTCSRSISVQDITPPSITCPTVSSPISCPASPSFGAATASDACDPSVAVSFSDATTPGSCPANYTVTRTWTATDDCGNTSTCSRSISVQDITPPSITCPTVTSPLDCPASANFGAATASDACDPSVAISFSDATTPGSCPGNYTVTRTWTATDDCGNTSTCSRTVQVRDITPPAITCPTVTSPINCPATPTFGAATASDACDPSVAVSFSDATTPGSCPGNYSVTRTWTATDDCGNTSTCSRTIAVHDITPPSITCPTVTSPLDCPASANFGAATASDACDPSVAISFSDATTPGSCPGNYTVTRTWTATDDCGNTSTCSRTVQVRDITPPAITCPSVSSPINCPATPTFGAATASDACDPSVAVSFSDATTPGNCPGNYSVTRTWTATDDCGNTSTCSRTIAVQDITPPAITCPTVTSPIDCPASPTFGAATASDACDPSVAVSFSDATTPGNCPGNYSVTRTWTATDDCGNTSTCSRTIAVHDITPPAITCPTVTSPINCPATPTFAAATASDACDPSVAVSFSDATTPGNCPGNYSVTRTWTATDDCGNTSTCSRTIAVQDITPPAITCPSVVSPINCPATPTFAAATASDACDPSVAVSFSDATTPGNCPGNYSVTRTWTATDDCGNTSTCSRTIAVQDITPPTITCPTVVSPINCPAQPSFGTATASDACDPSVAISFVDVTTPGCTGGVTRTWTATDDCGNTATCSRTIVIHDITPPSITCPSVVSPINCPATPTFAGATATDNCDASVDVTFSDATTPGNCPGNYSVTRTWTATDDCGNTSTCSRTIAVQDITPPAITCPTVTSPINCPATPTFAAATASDACDPSVAVSFSDATTPGNCPGNYSVTRTWTATDDCGNTSTCSRTIAVHDITPPAITCPSVVSPINCPATPTFAAATASDACDPSVAVSFSDATTPGNCPGNYSVTRTWTATDDCGNTSTCSRTIAVQDITPPAITCPSVVSPINCPATPTFAAATASDACDPSVAVSFSDATTPGNCPGNYSVTRTWTATDDCGNTSTCSRTIAVQDITPPAITCPAVSSPIDCPATPTFGPATASDACDPSVAVSFSDATTPGNCPGNYSVTRTWTATDDCGNTSTCSRTIAVRDITPPSITCPSVVSPINCPATPTFGPATASDACDPSVAVSFSDATTPGNCPGNYSVTRTWTATDDCGNTSTCSRTIAVQDITPPAITCPAVTSPIDCPASANFGAATASDACDPSVAISFSDATTPGSCPGNYTVTRTWTATDDCGNTSTCSRTVQVRDITPPAITCPTVVSPINCPATPTFAAATASDACDPSVAVSFSDATTPGNCPGNYSVTRTWTATDDCGNTSTCSRTIAVHDITPPAITCPSVVSPINCPATPTFAAATASDACDPSVAVSFSDATTPGNCPGNYSVTRTWTATDDCGNTSTCSRTIAVQDITPPAITCPAVSSPIDCPATPTFGPATASDACDPSVAVSFSDATTPGNCPGNYSVTRTWTATDDCGNTSTCSRTIAVRDITPPSITCPSVSSPIDCPATPTFAAATASDACDPSVAVSFSDATTPGNCPGNYSVTRTWTATDDCGNTSTCSRTIAVRDITPPSITCPSVVSPINCPATPTFAAATASDACDPSVAVSFSDATTPGNCPGNYSVTRTWTATDDCGNTSTCSRTIAVQDITPPAITCPSVVSPINCPASPTFAAATASDACDPSVAVSFSDATTPGNCPGNYSVTRTWTATDDCGNTSTCSRTIAVQDITPPAITCPSVVTPINCPATPTFGPATASDACDPSVAVSFSDATTPGNCPGNYSVTRTWTATDDCGNTSTCSRTIAVQDITPPAITCPSVVSPINCPATPTFGPATASDACDPSVAVSFSDATTPGNCPGNYSVTRTWTATDDCGNTSTCSRTIAVQDITPPAITCPSVSTPIDCPATPTFGPATASDACDPSVAVSFSDATTPGNCPGNYSVTRTWTATDDCGNTSTCSRTIAVRDITPPSITCPSVVSPINCPATPTFAAATASDACDPSVAVSFSDATTPGNCPGNYSVTRTWTATDDCGNTSTCSRTIAVQDITPPAITCPSVVSPINCPATPTFAAATASDACDPSVAVSFSDATTPGNCPGNYSVTRTWTATDDCGNTSACSRTIAVQDITPPAITCPAVSSPIDCPATPIFAAATASDACDASVDITFSDATTPGNCLGNYSVTRTWTATDDCGNTSTCSRTIAVHDITPPVITCPVVTSPINCPNAPVFGAATATDACDASVDISFSDVTTTVSCGTYSVTRTWTATDDCGNTSTCSATISVVNVPASCSLVAPTPRPFCGSAGNTLCVSAVNAAGYQWVVVSGTGWIITSGATTNCITYTAGSSDSVTFRVYVTNACGCVDSCEVSYGCILPYWGCTLGFWKNHTAIWNDATDPISMCVAAGISTMGGAYSGNGTSGSSFMTTFGLTPAQMSAAGYATNMTLVQALNLGGGTWGLLARSGVAALLNSCGLSGHYFYNNPTQVLLMVHNSVASGSPTNANSTGNDFQVHNEARPDNCPAGGPAQPGKTKRTVYGAAMGDDNMSVNAYPNPFTAAATIEFELTSTENVNVTVFDLNGKRISELYNGTAEAGQTYKVELNGTNLPAGIYIYRITAGDEVFNDRLILMK